MIEVRDDDRILRFDGVELGHSSSRRRGVPRWVEFQLFRTNGGSYILSRVGVSTVYHEVDCPVAKKYDLDESPRSSLPADATPCVECHPELGDFPFIRAEELRHWAQRCDTPAGVVGALYKRDRYGNRHLTYVARDLLDMAAEQDPALAQVYKLEIVD